VSVSRPTGLVGGDLTPARDGIIIVLFTMTKTDLSSHLRIFHTSASLVTITGNVSLYSDMRSDDN